MTRIGLGCMRLSTDDDRDDARALATIAAALDGGARWLDTAHAYGRDANDLGHNERLLSRALASRAPADVRIATKCGMARPDGRWEPDGRAATVLDQARASMAALGRPPDVLFLHAPDGKVPLKTSVRALVRAQREGLTRAIGLSNVTRRQLDELGRDVEIAAVQVALGATDDAAARGGVLAWCKARGAAVFAHSSLGGPVRAGRLARDPVLQAIAARCSAREKTSVTAAMVVLAYLLEVDACIVPIVGARRPETAASAMDAGRLVLDSRDLVDLDVRFPGLAMTRRPAPRPSPAAATAEVVIVMGIPGSGKTRLTGSWALRGYERLNRDVLGGTLAGIAKRLAALLAAGSPRVVLDNTYTTRASRSEVLRVAHAAGALVRCLHLDTPTEDAQVNIATRMLERHGELFGGSELTRRAKGDPGLLAPTALLRMERQLEAPSEEEGFASIDVVPFLRAHVEGGAGAAIPVELLLRERERDLALRPDADLALARVPERVPLLVFGWRAGADTGWTERARSIVATIDRERQIDVAVCGHPAGAAVCWCRPPLPGLWLAFARRLALDPRKSVLVAATSTHRRMAQTLGMSVMDA